MKMFHLFEYDDTDFAPILFNFFQAYALYHFYFQVFPLPLHIGLLTRQLVRWFLRLHRGQMLYLNGLPARLVAFIWRKSQSAKEAASEEQQNLPFARIPLRKHAYNARNRVFCVTILSPCCNTMQ